MITEVTGRYLAIQYTGGNGTAVADAVDGTVISDSGTVLVFELPNNDQFTLNLNYWYVWQLTPDVSTVGLLSNGDYLERYLVFPSSSAATAVGAKTVPALLLGASTNVDVDLSRSMADTSYTPSAFLVGAAGQLSVTAVAVLDVNTIRVTVQAALAYAAGAQVVAVAHGAV